MNRVIGMSTGALYKKMPSTSYQAIHIQKSLGADALEICCLRKDELLGLFNLNAENIRSHFRWLSLHSPTDWKYGNDDETKTILKLLEEAHRYFQFDLVVIHPEKVKDWSVLENLPFPIGIENADWRKDFGKTAEDLVSVLAGTDFGLVLDVNHCFTNDKSMDLARELATQFHDRLCEIHLSGFVASHEPLCVTKQKFILEAVPNGSSPIIIESVCADEEQMLSELAYILANLRT